MLCAADVDRGHARRDGSGHYGDGDVPTKGVAAKVVRALRQPTDPYKAAVGEAQAALVVGTDCAAATARLHHAAQRQWRGVELRGRRERRRHKRLRVVARCGLNAALELVVLVLQLVRHVVALGMHPDGAGTLERTQEHSTVVVGGDRAPRQEAAAVKIVADLERH